MGGTYKKKQRAEKAKVKLKGAKLPKGLNVTKTDFKVRKITIREQLKEAQYIDGHRELNIKETISRVKHHSGQFRQEGLRTLREAVIGQHPEIRIRLNEIIQSVSALCLDPEKDIRRESFRTLSGVLSALSKETIAPFFHVIASYLRCAMTHIQTHIQEDSLLMLDVLLEHVPQLVATQSDKILQNFLEMISRVRVQGDHHQVGRTLSVHMGQKQTTVKWRSKVLQRLAKMLHTQAQYKAMSTSNNNIANYQIRTFNVKEPQYYALKHSTYNLNQPCDIASLFSPAVGDTHTINSESTLRGYIEHLMPLLLEAWLEVRPQTSAKTAANQTILSQDAAITLLTVVEIMTEIWALVDIHSKEMNNNDLSFWLQEEYAELFAHNFIPDTFPYKQNDSTVTEKTSKRNKKAVPSLSNDPYCLQQNISLAYLMCRFHAGKTQQITSNKFATLLKYLLNIASNLKAHMIENYAQLDLALRAYLLENALVNLKSTAAMQLKVLLGAVIAAFLRNDFPHKDGLAGRILILLCTIAQQPDLVAAYGTEYFEPFLQFLPQLLLKATISESALTSMSHLGKQKNVVFLEALRHVITEVIDNIQKIQVSGAINAFEGKKLIMNLFYWTDKSQSFDQAELLQRVEQNITDKRIVSYYKYILTQV